MSTQNKTSIEIELKKLNSNFNTFNKIMSSFLVIATSESTFKNKMNTLKKIFSFEYSWLCSCKGCKFLRFIKVK